MATDVGTGTVADRLRNFLRLTGRIPLKMDEMVVPVVNAQQLDQPPWRTADQNWGCELTSATPAAGFFACAGVELPARAAGVCRVTGILLGNAAAAARSYDIRVGPRGNSNYTKQGNVFNTENMTPVPAVIPTLAPEFFDFNENPLATGNIIGRIRLAIDQTIYIPVDVCLRGNFGQSLTIGQSLWVALRTPAEGVAVSFFGTFYPQAL